MFIEQFFCCHDISSTEHLAKKPFHRFIAIELSFSFACPKVTLSA
jgi:hypothetical protein